MLRKPCRAIPRKTSGYFHQTLRQRLATRLQISIRSLPKTRGGLVKSNKRSRPPPSDPLSELARGESGCLSCEPAKAADRRIGFQPRILLILDVAAHVSLPCRR